MGIYLGWRKRQPRDELGILQVTKTLCASAFRSPKAKRTTAGVRSRRDPRRERHLLSFIQKGSNCKDAVPSLSVLQVPVKDAYAHLIPW